MLPTPREDLWLSNTTGILQKKNWSARPFLSAAPPSKKNLGSVTDICYWVCFVKSATTGILQKKNHWSARPFLSAAPPSKKNLGSVTDICYWVIGFALLNHNKIQGRARAKTRSVIHNIAGSSNTGCYK